MDRENERYHMLQETGKLPPRRLDSAKPKLNSLQRKNKNNAKKIKKSQKGVMGPQNLFFQEEERDVYKYVFEEIKEEIIKKKGELSASDRMSLNDLCIARIRLYRKTRMESSFNKFFDRVVTQDPIAQTQSLLKSLGLVNDKVKETNANKDLLSKLLTEEAEESEDKKLTLNEWQESQQDDDEIKLQLFTPKDASMFNTDFADSEDSDDEDNNEQKVNALPF